MRFIDRTGCKRTEKGISKDIRSINGLTRTATKIAEDNGLGVLKRTDGQYRIVKACGLGAYEEFFKSLEEVDQFLKKI